MSEPEVPLSDQERGIDPEARKRIDEIRERLRTFGIEDLPKRVFLSPTGIPDRIPYWVRPERKSKRDVAYIREDLVIQVAEEEE